jgi:hypothetical protein
VVLVKEWLVALEQTLVRNRIPAAAGVASLRGMIHSAERGVIPTGLFVRMKVQDYRLKGVVAAEAVRQVNETVWLAIKDDVFRMTEAEGLARKLVALARFKGWIANGVSPTELSQGLTAIWQRLAADADGALGTVNLVGLAGPRDAMTLFARAVSEGPLVYQPQ